MPMLQYAIFNELVTLSSPSNPDRPAISNIEKIPLRSIQSEYDRNRFSKGTSEKWFIENKDAYLPRDTMVSMKTESDKGSNGRSIVLSRPFFYKIRIDIQHRMTSGVGVFPADIAIAKKVIIPFVIP